MLGYGYDPALSEGAVKPPVFLTSTFVFNTAEHGKEFFDYVAGRREPPQGEAAGLVYSRFNHPNAEIVEDRLADLRGGRGGPPFLLRHVGDRHHDPRLRPAGRRDPALAAALRRHRDAGRQDAGQLRHGRGRLRRRRRRGERAGGGRGRDGEGRVLGHHDRDALEPAQHAGRHRARRGASPTRSPRARASGRSSSATTPCSARSSRSRCGTGRTSRSTR